MTNERYMDIAYGFAKELAVAGKIEPKAKAISKFAREFAKEIAADFTEPSGNA